jgi:hypothetical protein
MRDHVRCLHCEGCLTCGVHTAGVTCNGTSATRHKEVVEHAYEMSGGGFHVWNTEPYIEEIYPLAQKIKASQRFGGKVYRRQVIVVEDWTEVPGE